MQCRFGGLKQRSHKTCPHMNDSYTARLRAEKGLKTPDALHTKTAFRGGCSMFITYDTHYRRVDGLPVVVLNGLLAE